MNECGNRENGAYCYFHPKEILVGVCHLCLNERLLILAAKQGLNPNSSKLHSSCNYKIRSCTNLYKSKPSVSLPKIFALGSLLSRRDIRHRRHPKSDHHDFIGFADDPDTTSTSLEDESFISIKFGDNGVASWDNKTSSTTNAVSKVSLKHSNMSWFGQTSVKHGTTKGCCNNINYNNNNNGSKCVVEQYAKPRASSPRWRKRIGHLLQVIRLWKSYYSSKANDSAARGKGNSKSTIEGVKVARNNINKGWIRALKMRIKE